jgi:hypothetical protein
MSILVVFGGILIVLKVVAKTWLKEREPAQLISSA